MRATGARGELDGKQLSWLLQHRSAAIVAIVSDGNVPYATRAWGLAPLPGSPARLRLVVSSDDRSRFDDRGESCAIAVTAGDPVTLRALQMKGRTLGPVEPATDQDRAEVGRYCDAFFRAVEEADGTDRRLMERLAPAEFVACTIEVDELYDQSPGPGAGAALSGPAGRPAGPR